MSAGAAPVLKSRRDVDCGHCGIGLELYLGADDHSKELDAASETIPKLQPIFREVFDSLRLYSLQGASDDKADKGGTACDIAQFLELVALVVYFDFSFVI